MSDSDTVPPPPPETAPLDVATMQVLNEEAGDTKKSAAVHQAIWLFCLVVLGVGSLAFFFVAPQVRNLPPLPQAAENYQTLQTEIDNIKKRVQTLESGVETLKNIQAMGPVAAPPSPVREEPPTDTTTSAHVNQMQGDMASLSSAMAALQAEMKASALTVTETRETATAMIASLTAFMSLRDQANAGHAFTHELSVLRDAAKNDTDLLGAAARLEPLADNGAATLTTLNEELMTRETTIDAELAKDAAQNWWERITAALQHLIVVRPLHGGTSDALLQLETALKKGNSDTAMETFRQLPANLQKNLEDWRQRLEGRQRVDKGIDAIASYFASRPAAKSP